MVGTALPIFLFMLLVDQGSPSLGMGQSAAPSAAAFLLDNAKFAR